MMPSFAQQLVAESIRSQMSPDVKVTVTECEKAEKIMEWIAAQPEPVLRIEITDAFGYGYSKTVVCKILNKLEKDGRIEKTGNRRNMRISIK